MLHRGWLAAAAAVALSSSVLASNRPFPYTYTLYAAPQGTFEFEQWAEYKGGSEENKDAKQWDFREEFEYAATDNLSIALYLPSWHIEDTGSGTNTKFDSVGVETIWYLTNPVTDPVGVGLYAEANFGDEEVEVEGKVLLQKDVGNWVFAYNLILETEIEDAWKSEKETEGILGNSFGVAYSLTPGLRIGGELVVESEYAQWRHYEETTVYAGPNASYQGGKFLGSKADWWVAVTPLLQLSSIDDEPDFKARMIFGLEF